ncbi:hypothetical protein [Oceanobacillus piezotolerans]|uniref:hypothetical protein n=1 Tax=Oceanobacillus piezotolerans TaxID=2448030 RepID=UPI0011C42DA6|nr:hypothetical protein [Oceanobacillus piezotolerans]
MNTWEILQNRILYTGPTGIHSLEIKNFGAKGNWNIHISKDGQWQKVFQNGNREPMKDVGNQMNYHIAVKERFLNGKLKEKYGGTAPKIKVHAAIVIANDTVMVENESELPVLRLSSLYRYLEKEVSHVSEEWQDRIVRILEDHKKSGKPYEVQNFQANMEKLLLEAEHISKLFDLRFCWLKGMQEEFTSTAEDSMDIEIQRSSNQVEETPYLISRVGWLGILLSIPLLCIAFYAWIYRNFLGLGEGISSGDIIRRNHFGCFTASHCRLYDIPCSWIRRMG